MSDDNRKKFCFENEVKKHYHKGTSIMLLKDIYNYNESTQKGKSTKETVKKGVYALYLNNELKKIGKSTDKKGIFHRMSQYYRRDKHGGLKEIDDKNKNIVQVEFFDLSSGDECWIAERRLQVIAFDYGEEMPWEHKSRN